MDQKMLIGIGIGIIIGGLGGYGVSVALAPHDSGSVEQKTVQTNPLQEVQINPYENIKTNPFE